MDAEYCGTWTLKSGYPEIQSLLYHMNSVTFGRVFNLVKFSFLICNMVVLVVHISWVKDAYESLNIV